MSRSPRTSRFGREAAVTLLAAGLACEPATAAQLPFAASIQSVIEGGRIDGHPVSVFRFRTRLPVDDVRSALARAWGPLPVVTREDAQWHVVSAFDDGTYRTVQMRDDGAGGSEGLYSVWSAASPDATSPFDAAAVLPAGAVVLRRVAAVDSGRHAETVVARHAGTAEGTLVALDRRLARAGFVADPVPGAGPDAGLRVYRRRGREVAFTVASRHGTTAIVLHVTESTP